MQADEGIAVRKLLHIGAAQGDADVPRRGFGQGAVGRAGKDYQIAVHFHTAGMHGRLHKGRILDARISTFPRAIWEGWFFLSRGFSRSC